MFKIKFLMLFSLTMLAGCSSETPSVLNKRTLAKGTFTYQGAPLSKTYVVFTPKEAGKGEEQICELAKNGNYALSLFPGKYKISLQGNKNIPQKYWSPKTTDKEIEISNETKDNLNIAF